MLFRSALAPAAATALAGHGTALITLARFRDAESWCRRALALDPLDAVARAGTISACAADERTEPALVAARQALALLPAVAALHLEYARTLQRRDRIGAAERAMRGTPMLQRTDTRLDYFWSRPAIAGLPRAQWALAATTAVTIPDGTFSLRTISDDAARVWVDGRLVIDRWTPHESTVDYAPIVPGRHDLRVEYFQVDGWVELRLDFIRGAQRSSGSAGPH